jgi:hypothetical protein
MMNMSQKLLVELFLGFVLSALYITAFILSAHQQHTTYLSLTQVAKGQRPKQSLASCRMCVKHRRIRANRWIVTGEIGNVQGRETAFEQPVMFKLFRHLAIKQCEGAHDILCLSFSYAVCLFLDTPRAFQETFCLKTEIHIAGSCRFSHSNAFAEHRFRSLPAFPVDKLPSVA